MRIAVIVAMQKELSLLLSRFEKYEEKPFGDFKVYVGQIYGHTVIVSQCGIGKVNAALRAYEIIREFHPELVVNSGVAGGVDSRMKIGSVLVADRIAYHDVWCGPGTEYGAADGCPRLFRSSSAALSCLKEVSASHDSDVVFGLLCSGDKFISTPAQVDEIKSHFPDALGCDMESAAIAQACLMMNVPFVVVRVMSDMPGGGENISQYNNFWEIAPERTFQIVFDFIKILPDA